MTFSAPSPRLLRTGLIALVASLLALPRAGAGQAGSPGGPVPVENLEVRRATLLAKLGGGVAILPLPQGPGVKQTPFFVLVGEQDGGAKVWRTVAPAWREAGVPLTIRYVPGKGHTWLFEPKQFDEAAAWLEQITAGKLPSDPAPEKPKAE